MLPAPLLYLLFAVGAQAQLTTESGSVVLAGTRSYTSSASGTPTYASYGSVETISTSSSSTNGTSTMAASNSSTTTTSQEFPTYLVGTNSGNSTATGTSTSATATNTQACNSYVEFCDRSYSNITYVAAHNAPFAIKGNAASNQDYGIFAQLNDGIRMLQSETHSSNGEMRLCHTECDLLDAGSVEEWFANATTWLDEHPFEVVTFLLVNSNYADDITSKDYVSAVETSGIQKYLYEPPKVPMALHDWPTTAELIISGKRVLMFMDYNANQTAVPYIMDQFSQLWETPYSPQNQSFPCNQDRPPKLSNLDAGNRMYMANHNLNTDISIGSFSILLPNTVEINSTNAEDVGTFGSLGLAVQNCQGSSLTQELLVLAIEANFEPTEQWTRPPNFLLVDYYNHGKPSNGSVFQVAAKANNVTYTQKCCGYDQEASGARISMQKSTGILAVAFLFAVWILA